MRKLGILGAALCALLALSAFVVSTAFAADEAIWLVNGALVLENLNAETEGEVLLIFYNSQAGATPLLEIKCSYILDGTIGPNGVDEITKVLTLTEVEVGNDGTTLAGTPLLCESFISPEAFDCETGAEKAEIWPANLPWKTQLELMLVTGEEDILDVFLGTGGEPGWEIRCKTLSGLTLENLCAGPATVLVENSGTGSVLGFFNKVPVAERGNCTLTGEHTAEVVSDVSGDTWAIGAALTERLTTAVNDCEAEPTACTE